MSKVQGALDDGVDRFLRDIHDARTIGETLELLWMSLWRVHFPTLCWFEWETSRGETLRWKRTPAVVCTYEFECEAAAPSDLCFRRWRFGVSEAVNPDGPYIVVIRHNTAWQVRLSRIFQNHIEKIAGDEYKACRRRVRDLFRVATSLNAGLTQAIDELEASKGPLVRFEAHKRSYVALLVLAGFLGSGWRWRPLESESARAQFNDLMALLEQDSNEPGLNDDHRERALAYAHLLGETPWRTDSTQLRPLLVDWVALHADLRACLGQGSYTRTPSFFPVPGLDGPTRVQSLMHRTVVGLQSLVEATLVQKTQEPNTSGFRSKTPALVAWLCIDLLKLSPERWLSGAWGLQDDRVRKAASLAYVIRELLRAIEFGDTPLYQLSVDTFREAVADVVACHAHQVLGVDPRLNLSHQLRRLDAESRQHPNCVGLFRHTIEVYAGLQFLLDVHIDARTVSEVLTCDTLGAGANDGDAQTTKDRARLKRAVGLAALFHDAGLPLVGQQAMVQALKDEVPDDVEAAISGAAANSAEANAALKRAAFAEVGASSLMRGFSQEGVLRRWLEHGADGHVHELLGAWRFLRAVRGRLVAVKDEWLVRMAGRGILLHAAAPVPVETKQEPVAFLLSLAEALFNWEPHFAGGFPTESSNQPASLLGLTDRAQSRSRAWRIDGLTFVEGVPQIATGTDVDGGQGVSNLQITITLDSALADSGQTALHWLNTAQTLSRFSRPKDFGVIFQMEMEWVGWRRDAAFGNLKTLRAAVGRMKGSEAGLLRAWLTAVEDPNETRFTVHSVKDGDALQVELCASTPSAWWRGDLQHIFPQIQEAALEVIRRERMLQASPSFRRPALERS